MKITKKSKNGGCGMIKKILSITTAIVLLFSYTCMTISAANEDTYFSYSFSNGAYNATLKSEVELLPEDLTVPDTFNDGVNGLAPVNISNLSYVDSGNNTVKTITTKSSVGGNVARVFRYLNALAKVEFTNLATFTFKNTTFRDCSTTLKDVYIHASEVTFTGTTGKNAFTTFINNDGAKIHVASESVKQAIINGTNSGTAKVPEDMIVVDVTDDRPVPTINVTCDDIKYGDAKFNPSVEVTYVDAEEQTIPVENPTVTYGLFADEDCTQPKGDPTKDVSVLSPGTYYLKATLEGTADYQGGSKVIPVKVTEWADKSNLNKALDNAYKTLYTDDEHQQEADLSEYVQKAVDNLKNAVQSATLYSFRNMTPKKAGDNDPKDEDGNLLDDQGNIVYESGYDGVNSNPRQSTLDDPKACQAEVDYVTQVINAALAGLVKKGEFDKELYEDALRARYNKFMSLLNLTMKLIHLQH